jgi:hypothetical protein
MNAAEELRQQVVLFRNLLNSIIELNDRLNDISDRLDALHDNGIQEGNAQYDVLHDQYLFVKRIFDNLVDIRDSYVGPEIGYHAGYRIFHDGGHEYRLVLKNFLFGFDVNIPGMM